MSASLESSSKNFCCTDRCLAGSSHRADPLPMQVGLLPECVAQGRRHREAPQVSPWAGGEGNSNTSISRQQLVLRWLPYGTGMDARDSLCMRRVKCSPAGPGPFYFLFSSQVPALSLNSLKYFTPKGHPQPSPLCNSESHWYTSLIASFLYINYPERGQTSEMFISWQITRVVDKTCLEWREEFSKIP